MPTGIIFGTVLTPDSDVNITPILAYLSGATLTATGETATYYISMANAGPSTAGEASTSWLHVPRVVQLHFKGPGSGTNTITAYVGSSVQDIVTNHVVAHDLFATDIHDVNPDTAVSPIYIDISANAGGPFEVLAIELVADTAATVQAALVR